MPSQKRVALFLTMKTRTLNIDGLLSGFRILRPGTKAVANPNKWWTDLLTGLRELGFTVSESQSSPTTDPPAVSSIDAETLAANLCHAQDSGLQSDPETADKVAAWILKNYDVQPIE